jgi:hypothetical protein
MPAVLAEYLGQIPEELLPPLVVLGLANLVFCADVRHCPSFQALDDDVCLGPGVPFPAVHVFSPLPPAILLSEFCPSLIGEQYMVLLPVMVN